MMLEQSQNLRQATLAQSTESIRKKITQLERQVKDLSLSVYANTNLSVTAVKTLLLKKKVEGFDVTFKSADSLKVKRRESLEGYLFVNSKNKFEPWSSYLVDDKNEVRFEYQVPVYSNQKLVGILSGALNINKDEILSYFRQTNVNVFIHNQFGELVYHPDFGVKYIRSSDAYGINILAGSARREPLMQFINSNIAHSPHSFFMDLGNKYLASTWHLPELGWFIVAYENEQHLLAAQQKAFTEFITFAAIALILVFVLTYILSLLIISRPLKVMTNLVNSPGQVSNLRLLGKQDDELADLSEAIYQQLYQLNRTRELDLKTIGDLESKLADSKGLAQVIAHSDNAIVTLGLDYCIMTSDIKMASLIHSNDECLKGVSYFEFVHPHMAFIKEQIKNELRRKQSWRGELILKPKGSDDEVWVNCSITSVRDDLGTVIRYVVSQQDISSIKESQNKIERLVYTDDLTNLSNRTFFVAQLEKLVEISKRGRYDFALIYFDVDDFKKVNDLYGHEVGDLLLKELSTRLSYELRNEDTLARMSGDEFAMLLGGIKSEQDVIVKAHAILAAASLPFTIKGKVINSGVSIGVTMSTTDSQDPELLLQHADLAMYEAKSLGKSSYHFYTKALNDATRLRIQMENELAKAIDKQELELVFQPKVNSQSMELVGFEALLRWHNDTLGFISPADFIPLAEQSNLILKIGSWVIEQAAEFVSQQNKKVPVSINLSAKQFESGKVTSELKATIERYGIKPSLLEVEITESSLMTDVEDAIRQLYSIQALGVGISIDDFGTGYSSLAYIKRFPVETLKIDRSFIKDIPDDESDMEITAAIIAMSQKLGLEVIAEGAETLAQVDYLAQNGCYLIQGYFYSKPLSAADAHAWQPNKEQN
ncbi:EAL domain-containing protein [Psychrosphaera haliotis]|uniref:EAL domain-containing protein n=1 Tax=Psychrosphaera haliotis TaxID=555083 RepID=UPI002375079B|nr:EAL domain-containing protein [Psychrosphaera haliotis]